MFREGDIPFPESTCLGYRFGPVRPKAGGRPPVGTGACFYQDAFFTPGIWPL